MFNFFFKKILIFFSIKLINLEKKIFQYFFLEYKKITISMFKKRYNVNALYDELDEKIKWKFVKEIYDHQTKGYYYYNPNVNFSKYYLELDSRSNNIVDSYMRLENFWYNSHYKFYNILGTLNKNDFCDFFYEVSYLLFIFLILSYFILYNKKRNLLLYIYSTRFLILYSIVLNIFLLLYTIKIYFLNAKLPLYAILPKIFLLSELQYNLLPEKEAFNLFEKFNLLDLPYYLQKAVFFSSYYNINNFQINSRLVFNNLFIVDSYSYFVKFFLVFIFLLINIILFLQLFSPFKGNWQNSVKKYFGTNNIIKKILFTTKYGLLNLEFLRNFLLFSYIILFFLFNLVSCYDILSLFVCIEGITLCLYILSGLKYNNRLSVEAGLKYFLISAIFSCIFGMSLFLLYFVTSVTNFYEIRQVILNSTQLLQSHSNLILILYLSIVMLIIVFLLKLGTVPFHFWIGDIYQGSPLLITSFFATITRIGFFAILFRLFYNVFYFALNLNLSNIFFFFGVTSIIYGSFYSLNQYELKKFLAYSSIVHTGFILIGLSTLSMESIKASMLYLYIYIFTLFCFFFILISAQAIFQYYDNKNLKIYIRDFKYLSDLATLPLSLRFFIAILLFSMAGFPPLPGFLIKLYIFKIFLLKLFYSIKYYLFYNLLGFNFYILMFLFFIIFLLSFLTAYNYIRIIIKILFFNKLPFLNNSIFLINSYTNSTKVVKKNLFNILIFLLFIINFFIIYYFNFIYNFDYNFNFILDTIWHPFYSKNYITKDFSNLYDFNRFKNVNKLTKKIGINGDPYFFYIKYTKWYNISLENIFLFRGF